MEGHGIIAKYNFFCKSDPYYAYYQLKLTEYNDRGEPTDYDEKLCPDVPDPHKYSVSYPKGITAEKLDVMMLTAQFEARYGPRFLADLEDSNVISTRVFEFVDPIDETYAQLVAAYSDVVDPPKNFKENLKNSAADMTIVLERCFHRLQWYRFLQQERQQAKDQRLRDITETAKIYGVNFMQPPPMSHLEEPEPKRLKFDKSALDEMIMMSSTLIEQTRSKHEEIERLERMVMKELDRTTV